MGVFHHGRGGMAAGAGGGWTQAERDERWHSAHFLLFFSVYNPSPWNGATGTQNRTFTFHSVSVVEPS